MYGEDIAWVRVLLCGLQSAAAAAGDGHDHHGWVLSNGDLLLLVIKVDNGTKICDQYLPNCLGTLRVFA